MGRRRHSESTAAAAAAGSKVPQANKVKQAMVRRAGKSSHRSCLQKLRGNRVACLATAALSCAAVASLAVMSYTTWRGPARKLLATSPHDSNASTQGPPAGLQLLATFPHDPKAFTQGLVFVDGVLYESTGLRGRSSLRQVDADTGKVVRSTALSNDLFGEGIASWSDDSMFMLTWQSQVGFEYDRHTFKVKRQFSFSTTRNEGWGITHDGSLLVVSDGSHVLHWWDPVTLKEVRTVEVTSPTTGNKVTRLNELEFVGGEIWANVWFADIIARIDPSNGDLIGTIDCSFLNPRAHRPKGEDVFNGIAWDASTNTLYLTGKLWNNLYKLRLDGDALDPPLRL